MSTGNVTNSSSSSYLARASNALWSGASSAARFVSNTAFLAKNHALGIPAAAQQSCALLGGAAFAHDATRCYIKAAHLTSEDPVGRAVYESASSSKPLNISGVYMRPDRLIQALTGSPSTPFPSQEVGQALQTLSNHSQELYTALSDIVPEPPLYRPKPSAASPGPAAPEILGREAAPLDFSYQPNGPARLPERVVDQAKLTDTRLARFSRSLSHYIAFSSLLWGAGLLEVEREMGALFAELENDPTASPWQIFHKRHGKELGWISYIWCKVLYFFVYSLGVVPKVLDTYMQSALKALRSTLKNPEKQQERFGEIVAILSRVFKAYIAAHERFVKDGATSTKTLADFRQEALEECVQLLAKEAPSARESKEKAFQRRINTLIRGFIDHIAPDVSFPFLLKRPLNWAIRFSLKNIAAPQISPALFSSLVSSTRPSQLRRTLIGNLATYVDGLKEEEIMAALPRFPRLSSLIPAIPASGNVAAALSSVDALSNLPYKDTASDFFKVIKLSTASPDEVAPVLEALKHPPSEPLLQDLIKTSIKKGTLGGIDAALPYLLRFSFEPLFANLLGTFDGVLTHPAEQPLPEYDLQNALASLKQKCADRLQNTTKRVVQEILEGIEFESSKKAALEVFHSSFKRSQDLLKTAQEDIVPALLEKLSQESLHETDTIYPYLLALQKQFESMPKQAELESGMLRVNDFERETVFEALLPVYSDFSSLMEHLAPLAKLQQQYLYDQNAVGLFEKIKLSLETLRAAPGEPRSLEALQEIGSLIDEFARTQPPHAAAPENLRTLLAAVRSESEALARLQEKQETLGLFYSLVNELKNLALQPARPRFLGWDLGGPALALRKKEVAKDIRKAMQDHPSLFPSHLLPLVNQLEAWTEGTEAEFLALWEPLVGKAGAALAPGQAPATLYAISSQLQQEIATQKRSYFAEIARLETARAVLVQGAGREIAKKRDQLREKANTLSASILAAQGKEVAEPVFQPPISTKDLSRLLSNDLPDLVRSIPGFGTSLVSAAGSLIEQFKALLERGATKEEFMAWIQQLPKTGADAIPFYNPALRESWALFFTKVAALSVAPYALGLPGLAAGAGATLLVNRREQQRIANIENVMAFGKTTAEKAQTAALRELSDLYDGALASVDLTEGLAKAFVAAAAQKVQTL